MPTDFLNLLSAGGGGAATGAFAGSAIGGPAGTGIGAAIGGGIGLIGGLGQILANRQTRRAIRRNQRRQRMALSSQLAQIGTSRGLTGGAGAAFQAQGQEEIGQRQADRESQVAIQQNEASQQQLGSLFQMLSLLSILQGGSGGAAPGPSKATAGATGNALTGGAVDLERVARALGATGLGSALGGPQV